MFSCAYLIRFTVQKKRREERKRNEKKCLFYCGTQHSFATTTKYTHTQWDAKYANHYKSVTHKSDNNMPHRYHFEQCNRSNKINFVLLREVFVSYILVWLGSGWFRPFGLVGWAVVIIGYGQSEILRCKSAVYLSEMSTNRTYSLCSLLYTWKIPLNAFVCFVVSVHFVSSMFYLLWFKFVYVCGVCVYFIFYLCGIELSRWLLFISNQTSDIFVLFRWLLLLLLHFFAGHDTSNNGTNSNVVICILLCNVFVKRKLICFTHF